MLTLLRYFSSISLPFSVAHHNPELFRIIPTLNSRLSEAGLNHITLLMYTARDCQHQMFLVSNPFHMWAIHFSTYIYFQKNAVLINMVIVCNQPLRLDTFSRVSDSLSSRRPDLGWILFGIIFHIPIIATFLGKDDISWGFFCFPLLFCINSKPWWFQRLRK